jgi:hypothetical protein
VERPVDHAVKGTGMVHSKGTKLIGTGTKFKQELGYLKIVEVNGKEVSVISVENDELATCSGEVCSNPSNFKIQPNLDNNQMFSKVMDQFRDQNNVLILPEGRSHETPGTIKFKSGIGKMVINAIEQGIPVKVYATGLNYTFPGRLRNKVMVRVQLVEIKKEELQGDSRMVVKNIVKRFHSELENLVVNLEDYSEVKFVYFATNMIIGKDADSKFSKWKELEKKLNNLKTNNKSRFDDVITSFKNYQGIIDQLRISKYHYWPMSGADCFLQFLCFLSTLLIVTFI